MTFDDVVHRYFASVRSRDIDTFVSLFAPDATITTPDGTRHAGLEAIRVMESAVFASDHPPAPSPEAFVVGDGAIAVEIDVAQSNGARHRMASFFRMDADGRIARLSIYRQAIRQAPPA